MQKIEIKIDGSTLPFYEFELNGEKFCEFDASECSCPEPMVNAMAGLKFITQNSNIKLIMINSHEPKGLYANIKDKFHWNAKELEQGKVKIEFNYIHGKSETTDFSKTECAG